ncbi:MAG: polysaccharide pyruvyl transferase family protein [Pseudomonadota bacterium]
MIVAHLSGRPVAHGGMKQADLFAVGSIIQLARRVYKEGGARRPTIWGSGMLAPVPRDFLPHVDVAAVRGPVSAALLGLETDAMGDPGLLIPEVIAAPARADRIGIVPHHSLMDDPALTQLLRDPAYVLIDPRGDAVQVVQAIASCAHIFASSLHGLIVADAYGVPNTWVAPTGQGWLKYHDYAASVGRAMIAPILLQDIPGRAGKPDQPVNAYQDGIDRARAALKQTFPAQFRADAQVMAG